MKTYSIKGVIKIPFHIIVTSNSFKGEGEAEIRRQLTEWIDDPISWGRRIYEFEDDHMTPLEVAELLAEDHRTT